VYGPLLGALLEADHGATQIVHDTRLLHTDCIDEGAEDEFTFGRARPAPHAWCPAAPPRQRKVEQQNWRERFAPPPPAPAGGALFPSPSFEDDFGRAEDDFAPRAPADDDWRQAKVAANHLKFCPGDQCRVWLPLHSFGANPNTQTGLDIYCIGCNARRRTERKSGQRAACPPHAMRLDKFEVFAGRYKGETVERTAEDAAEDAVSREVAKRIASALEDAEKRFNRRIPIEPDEVSRRMFMRKRFVCNVTGQVLDPRCFLDHHSLTLELRQAVVPDAKGRNRHVVDIICSDCRLCCPPLATPITAARV
jgi:hypothetical protein